MPIFAALLPLLCSPSNSFLSDFYSHGFTKSPIVTSLFSTSLRPKVTSQCNLADLSAALGIVDHSLFLETIVPFFWLSSYHLGLCGWILFLFPTSKWWHVLLGVSLWPFLSPRMSSISFVLETPFFFDPFSFKGWGLCCFSLNLGSATTWSVAHCGSGSVPISRPRP